MFGSVGRVAAANSLKSEKNPPHLKKSQIPRYQAHSCGNTNPSDSSFCLTALDWPEFVFGTHKRDLGDIVAGVALCRHVRGSYTEYEPHSSAAQDFYMGSSISTGDDLPSVASAAVDHIPCDTEV